MNRKWKSHTGSSVFWFISESVFFKNAECHLWNRKMAKNGSKWPFLALKWSYIRGEYVDACQKWDQLDPFLQKSRFSWFLDIGIFTLFSRFTDIRILWYQNMHFYHFLIIFNVFSSIFNRFLKSLCKGAYPFLDHFRVTTPGEKGKNHPQPVTF